MWRRHLRIQICTKIESRSSSVFVRQDFRTARNIRLAPDTRSPFVTSSRKSFFDRRDYIRIASQFQVQQARRELTRDVIGSRAETTSHKDDVG